MKVFCGNIEVLTAHSKQTLNYSQKRQQRPKHKQFRLGPNAEKIHTLRLIDPVDQGRERILDTYKWIRYTTPNTVRAISDSRIIGFPSTPIK